MRTLFLRRGLITLDKKRFLDAEQLDLVLKAFLFFFIFSFVTKFIGQYIKMVEDFNLALDFVAIILLFVVRQYFRDKNRLGKG